MSSTLQTPFSYVLDRTDHVAPVGPEDLGSVAAAARAGDGVALERLVTSNTRLCVHIVNLIAPNGSLRDDLFSAALQGLTEAARTFDPAKGAFATHAGFLIRREVFQTLSSLGYPVCAPARYIKMRRNLRDARTRLEQRGEVVSVTSLANEANCKPDTVLAVQFLESPLLALDGEVAAFGNDSLSCERPTPASSVLHADDRDVLRRAMEDVLDKREREVLSGYYGLGNRPAESMATLCRRLGLTRQRLYQIAEGARAKLRAAVDESQVGE